MNADVARSIIYDAWKERQEVVFDTSGWHKCTANCKMTKLEAYACIDGNHAIATEKCEEHPESKPVLVSDLWVCNMTGKMHVCNGGKQCDMDQGICCITKQPVQCLVPARDTCTSVARGRRKRSFVYDNRQTACALWAVFLAPR